MFLNKNLGGKILLVINLTEAKHHHPSITHHGLPSIIYLLLSTNLCQKPNQKMLNVTIKSTNTT